MDSRSDLAALAVSQRWGLLELRPLSLSLEEVFLQLTTDESEAEEDLVAAEPVEGTGETLGGGR